MPLLVFFFLISGAIAQAGTPSPPENGKTPSVTPQVESLQERMLNDEGIMELVKALQDDPDMQALLADPKVMAAAQAGDIGALLADPRVMKLLQNPRIREIEKRVNGEAGIETSQ
jgi:hypothetical protein